MEIELFTNIQSEEDTVEVDAEVDNLGAEGERCGICMDVVIDRGVLDCCQHWFCFVCIDNWATITNLCPLCQNEFQLITCVSVYDTIGSSNNDEDSDSRDDDWCVEGNNNSLSLPSYYIDENVPAWMEMAAKCGVVRCLVYESDQNSDIKETCLSEKNVDHHRHLVHTSSGKVSMCVADSEETAVVVSRIDCEDAVDEPTINCQSIRELTNLCKVEQSMLGSDCCSSEMKKPSDQGIDIIQPESNIPSAKFGETVCKSEPDESELRMSLDLLSFASTLFGKNGVLILSILSSVTLFLLPLSLTFYYFMY